MPWGHRRDGVLETLPEGAGSREAPGQILADSGERLREPTLAGPCAPSCDATDSTYHSPFNAPCKMWFRFEKTPGTLSSDHPKQK
jgi:hypothetical protein